MLIADHIRKDVPSGSYSWQFIEAAVNKGALPDKETYLITRSTTQARLPSSNAPPKASRNKFTAEDDRILAEFVLSRKRKGETTAGNKMYEEFAKEVS